MPESTKEYDVLAYFHCRDPKTGKTAFYHPDGAHDPETGTGWADAKKTFRGDPNSDQVKDLLDGAGGDQGPLIAEKKASSSTTSSTSSSTSKES